MRSTQIGQSLTETLVLTAATAAGALGIWALCGERVKKFIDMVLSVIASPGP